MLVMSLFFKKILGLGSNESPVGLFMTEREDAHIFSQTKAGQKLPEARIAATRLFKTGKSVVVLNGDTCRPGQSIIVQVNNSLNVGYLEEILQEVGSDACNQGKADALLVHILDITGTSERLWMPQLSTTNRHVLLRTEVSKIPVFLGFD